MEGCDLPWLLVVWPQAGNSASPPRCGLLLGDPMAPALAHLSVVVWLRFCHCILAWLAICTSRFGYMPFLLGDYGKLLGEKRLMANCYL